MPRSLTSRSLTPKSAFKTDHKKTSTKKVNVNDGLVRSESGKTQMSINEHQAQLKNRIFGITKGQTNFEFSSLNPEYDKYDIIDPRLNTDFINNIHQKSLAGRMDMKKLGLLSEDENNFIVELDTFRENNQMFPKKNYINFTDEELLELLAAYETQKSSHQTPLNQMSSQQSINDYIPSRCNIITGVCLTAAAYATYLKYFTGGTKTHKQKSRKQKSRKQKSRRYSK
jgi:hypothetical protein